MSPRYYESTFSLNEMGAAWAFKTDYCSILTNDMKRKDMKGVINSSTISIKVDEPEAIDRMNELKDRLIEKFRLPSVLESKWKRNINAFLRQVNEFNS